MPRAFICIRWILATLILLLFFIVALVGIPTAAITDTLSQDDTVKGYLKQSGIYSDTLNILLGLFAQSMGGEGGTFSKELEARLTDSQSETGKIAAKIADPATVQQKVETVIDATYAWMEGKTERPIFEIALLDNREDFLRLLALGFREKAHSLPACDAGYKMSRNFDPLSTPCWPKAIPFSEIDRFLVANADIKEFDSLFAQTKFDSQTLEIPRETTKKVHRVFPWIQAAPWTICATLITLALLLSLLIPGFWPGAKITGGALLTSSFLTLLGKFAAASRFDTIFNAVTRSMSAEGQNIFLPVFEKIFKTLYFGILNVITVYALLAMGIGILLILVASLAKSDRFSHH